jgi:putative ABC transport system permease protein
MEAVMESLQGHNPIAGAPVPIPQVSPQQSIAFARSQYIMEYSITVTHHADNPEFTAVDADVERPPMMMAGGGDIENINMDEIIMPNFRIMGGAWDDEFIANERQISNGRMPQTDYEALISLEVAELNNLSIGDTIRLYSNLIAGEEYRTIYRELTIVGIYFDMTVNPFAGFLTSPFVNRRNEILTSFDTVMAYINEDDMGFTVDAVFYLHNPSYLAAFEAEARSLGLDDMLLVSTNEAEYAAIVAPVEGLRRVAQTFMWVVLILGGTILIILSTIAIRERKYEIGVLRAMGMKKHKVAAGLWTEMFTLTIICLIIGLTVGSAVAQPVSDTLLAAQVENVSLQNGNIGVSGAQVGGMSVVDLGSGSANYSAIDTLDISLGLRTIVEIIGISLLLTSIAVLAASTRITKYEPIKILMERN